MKGVHHIKIPLSTHTRRARLVYILAALGLILGRGGGRVCCLSSCEGSLLVVCVVLVQFVVVGGNYVLK